LRVPAVRRFSSGRHGDSAPIAPTAWSARVGSRRILRPLMPPSAARRIRVWVPRSRVAKPLQRSGPRAGAAAWLAVAKAGERNASAAPARAARRSSGSEWPELVRNPRARIWPGHRPPRRCTPAPSARASRTSPATTSTNLRARQMRARSRPSLSRSGSTSCRSITPAWPRGSRATAWRGSGSRWSSVNSQSRGLGAGLPRNPQASSPRSTPSYHTFR
jgi:hypothetical protein